MSKNQNLTGIVELKGKHVRLEDIEDPKLARVLHERMSRDFRFFGGKPYREYKESGRPGIKHRDNHEDRHNDTYHRDHLDSRSYMTNQKEAVSPHRDKIKKRGYSETINRGYSETVPVK